MLLLPKRLRMLRSKKSVSSGAGSLSVRSQLFAQTLCITLTLPMKLPSPWKFSIAFRRCRNVRSCHTTLIHQRPGATWLACTLMKPETSTLRSNSTILRRSRPCHLKDTQLASLRCLWQMETTATRMDSSASVRKKRLNRLREFISQKLVTQPQVQQSSRSTLNSKWPQTHQVISQS